ncbi:unnamed protein product, partial [Aphanomyces euteiches]
WSRQAHRGQAERTHDHAASLQLSLDERRYARDSIDGDPRVGIPGPTCRLRRPCRQCISSQRMQLETCHAGTAPCRWLSSSRSRSASSSMATRRGRIRL